VGFLSYVRIGRSLPTGLLDRRRATEVREEQRRPGFQTGEILPEAQGADKVTKTSSVLPDFAHFDGGAGGQAQRVDEADVHASDRVGLVVHETEEDGPRQRLGEVQLLA